jgi:hypothetical protein
MRKELQMRLTTGGSEGGLTRQSARDEMRRTVLKESRQAILAMLASVEIGDAAVHLMEEKLDWLEMAVG